MAYFNYHAKAVGLIKNGHCIIAELKKKHNSISPALVLYFDNHPPMPIREAMWDKYFLLLKNYSVNITNHLSTNL